MRDGVTMNNFGQLTVNFIVGAVVILLAVKIIAWVYDTYFRYVT
jgi:hypothetical protein